VDATIHNYLFDPDDNLPMTSNQPLLLGPVQDGCWSVRPLLSSIFMPKLLACKTLAALFPPSSTATPTTAPVGVAYLFSFSGSTLFSATSSTILSSHLPRLGTHGLHCPVLDLQHNLQRSRGDRPGTPEYRPHSLASLGTSVPR
jgi:hypothetical protein